MQVTPQGEPSEQDSSSCSSSNTGSDTTKDKYNKGHIVIPYIQGLGESIKEICRKYGIQIHFKGNRTIKNISSQKIRILWKGRAGPATGISVGSSHVMRST